MSKSNINTLNGLLKDEFYSPYKIAKFESILRGKQIPPQKLYGYVRNGYIRANLNSTQKIQISKVDAFEYLKKFVS